MTTAWTYAGKARSDEADHPARWGYAPRSMGKHSRRPERSGDPDDHLAPYHRRREPPADGRRRHFPVHGGATHVRPDEQRLLEEWDGFTYQAAGFASDLAEARAWAREDPS